MSIAFLFEIGIRHAHKNMNVLNVIKFNTYNCKIYVIRILS